MADDIDDDDDTEIDPTGGAGSGGKAGGRRQADPTAIDPDEDADEDPDGDGDPGDKPDPDAKDKPAKGKTPYTPPDEDAWLKVTGEKEKEAKLRKAREGTIRELKAKLQAAENANATDDQKAKAKVEQEIASKYKPVAVRASARAAFMEAGLADLSKERMTDLMRMVDLDDIEIDDDGTVLGLDEQVDAIKERWPQMFTTPEVTKEPERRRAPKATVADTSTRQPKRAQTMGQRIAERHNQT